VAAWTEPARVEAPPLRRPRAPRAVRREPREQRVTGGVLWIGALTVLLAGVVALNVAVLRLNLRLDAINRDRAELRADNAALQSRLSSAAATDRIQQLAQRAGFAPASPEQTTYVQIGR
jgi:hypothetical protein